MKVRSILASTLLLVGGMAFAQVCPATPGSVCLVPSPSMSAMQASTYTSTTTPVLTATTVPYTGMGAFAACPGVSTLPSGSYIATAPYGMSCYGPMTTSSVPSACGPYGMITPSYGVAQACSANVSPDTACLINQVNGLRSDIRSLQGSIQASALELRGQALVSRMNQLMADEMLFRQQLAMNPNLPNAQATAFGLTQRADALNRDIAAYNMELSMIPPDQRPFIASQLNSFTTAYWNPTIQRFAVYNSQFMAQASTSYQPAVAANPWLPSWESSYQASINNVASVPQTYASANWWSTTQVLGSTEVYPGCGQAMMVPQGSVLYVPSTSTAVCPTTSTLTTTTVVPVPQATPIPPAPLPAPAPVPVAPPPAPAPEPGTGY